MNGRRTPDANQALKGAIMGLNLDSDAPRIFRALVEATAFGSKAIVDRFAEEGVEIREIIGLGGVAKKSPFVMQTLANVLNMPIKVASTKQTCAFGAAMFAAVVGGVYSKVEDAQKAMGKGFDASYFPDKELAQKYKEIYKETPDVWAAYGFEAVLIINKCISKSNFSDCITGLDKKMTTGNIKFNNDGTVIRSFKLFEVKENHFVEIK